MNYLQQIVGWLEHRLQLRDSLWPLLRHPVPAALTGRVGWWYVFGSVTMTLLMLQIVTGICLATVYEPTAAGAYASLEYLNYEAPLGWLLRAIHYWSATGMVVMLIVHMTQVFLMGAFKYPRELTWLVGVALLALTLALAFTGQVLRFDGDSYWGIGVGASATGRVPAAGPSLVHLYLVVKRGISEPPEAGRPVDPAIYDREYEQLLERGVPFFPHALYRDGIACATAVIVVGFFVAAFMFDAIFVDAPFCKFVCPIGQFNFVQSLVSPAEVAASAPRVCASCQTKDCIAGNDHAAGCQLSLFLPPKAGNMDCTLCLDCADACPRDNVVLLSVRPGLDLTSDQRRSGIRRYSQRPDLAALMVVLLFAALVNAAWMTAPVVALEDQLTRSLGVDRWWIVTLGMLCGLCIVPFLMTAAVAKASVRAGQRKGSGSANLTRFAPALIPLGLGMWLAHYSFHFFSSGDTLLVAGARWAHDWLGAGYAVTPAVCTCCDASANG